MLEKVKENLHRLIGIALGVIMSILIISKGGDSGEELMNLGSTLILIYIGVFIHIIIHEGGHLIAGKLTGYTFSSFRVGPFMLMKSEGKWKMKRYDLPGTGGQCVMHPPQKETDDFPYILYNAGGVGANLLTSVIAVGIIIIGDVSGEIYRGLVIFIGAGVFLAITNGVPMKIGGLANDGCNIKAVYTNSQAKIAFWRQLYIHGRLTSGDPIEEIPTKYFALEDEPDLNDTLVCSLAVFQCNYLHSKGEWEAARTYSEYLIEKATGLMPIYKNELLCECLFYEMMDQNRIEIIESIYTKELQKYLQTTKYFISKRRVMYAYWLLVKQDEVSAEKEKQAFLKILDNYPFEGEIETEKQLMVVIENKYFERNEISKKIL